MVDGVHIIKQIIILGKKYSSPAARDVTKLESLHLSYSVHKNPQVILKPDAEEFWSRISRLPNYFLAFSSTIIECINSFAAVVFFPFSLFLQQGSTAIFI